MSSTERVYLAENFLEPEEKVSQVRNYNSKKKRIEYILIKRSNKMGENSY